MGSIFCFKAIIRKSLTCRNNHFFQLQLNKGKQTVQPSHCLPNKVAASKVCSKEPKQSHTVF